MTYPSPHEDAENLRGWIFIGVLVALLAVGATCILSGQP